MNIKMLGIDHTKASVEYREKFSMTKSECTEFVNMLFLNKKASGCVILSTCNRMEIWVNLNEPNDDINLYDLLCTIKKIESNTYHNFFKERKGINAVNHLFRLCCGIESMILGEDQIITQVKDALFWARENKFTDSIIEVLFRNAITAAKKVKTNVKLSIATKSAADAAVDMLISNNVKIEKANCLIIGNGEMGKLAALKFKEYGANVTVTLRQYKSGEVNIPIGCDIIKYDERLSFLKNCDIIVSATSSPNFTLKYDDILKYGYKKGSYFIDLAVPRDIEFKINDIDGINVFNIDSFEIAMNDENVKNNIKSAEQILDKYINEFMRWHKAKLLFYSAGSIIGESNKMKDGLKSI